MKKLSEEEMKPCQEYSEVFGFACNQTSTLMPRPIWLAHKLARRLNTVKLKRYSRICPMEKLRSVNIETANPTESTASVSLPVKTVHQHLI